MSRSLLFRALGVAACVIAIVAATPRAAGAVVPFAGGDSSANVPLDRAERWAMLRHVAARDGALTRFYVHIKVEGSAACPMKGRPGYAAGTTGRFLATTHPVTPDGRPQMARVLAADEVVPCERHRAESLELRMGFRVVAGQELATVIRNVDPQPAVNYASLNFLYRRAGVLGANGRNERSPLAPDGLYGLDPRETVGYSSDSGRTWAVPGGPYGAILGTTSFIPTYIQEYADGQRAGQPYYSSASLSGPVAMVWPRVPRPWRIEALGAYTSGDGAADVKLMVDGRVRAVVRLSGSGFLQRPIESVDVPAGATVRIETVAGADGLALRKGYGDAVWAGLMGLGTDYSWHLEGDPLKAAPLYPLGEGMAAGSPTPSAPPPSAPLSSAPPLTTSLPPAGGRRHRVRARPPRSNRSRACRIRRRGSRTAAHRRSGARIRCSHGSRRGSFVWLG